MKNWSRKDVAVIINRLDSISNDYQDMKDNEFEWSLKNFKRNSVQQGSGAWQTGRANQGPKLWTLLFPGQVRQAQDDGQREGFGPKHRALLRCPSKLDPPLPLQGIGLSHKGKSHFGGSITLKTTHYDITKEEDVPFEYEDDGQDDRVDGGLDDGEEAFDA